MSARARSLSAAINWPWSPYRIPTASLVNWWDADRPSSITVATGVSAWAPIIGANTLAQATGTKQPVYSASSGPNSRGGITFDGVDDNLRVTFTLVQPEQVFVVGKWNVAFAATERLFDGSAPNTMSAYRASGTTNTMNAGSSFNSAGQTPTAFHYNTYLFNGASSVIKQDGTQKGTGNCGANNGGGIVLGIAGDTAGNPGNVTISEVIVCRAALHANEELALYDYFKRKYAL